MTGHQAIYINITYYHLALLLERFSSPTLRICQKQVIPLLLHRLPLGSRNHIGKSKSVLSVQSKSHALDWTGRAEKADRYHFTFTIGKNKLKCLFLVACAHCILAASLFVCLFGCCCSCFVVVTKKKHIQGDDRG